MRKPIDYFEDEAGEWRFRVVGGNGEIVAQGEGYTRKADAVRGARTTRDILLAASDEDFEAEPEA